MQRITYSILSSIIFLTGGVLDLRAQDYTPKYELINKSEFPTNDLAVAMYNVLDYGADPTGKTDCTNIFQTLLDKAAGVGVKSGERGNYANPAGGIVYVPEGTYVLTGTLTIPRGVTLRGDWKAPVDGEPVKGTVLAIKSPRYAQGKTTLNYATIIMQPTTEVSNIAFWYPNQDINNVVALPPTILFGQGGYWGNDYCNVRHVTFVNSYTAIQFNHNNGGGCPNIFDVYGTPLKDGIIMDALADVGRLDGIHFSSKYWKNSGLENAPTGTELDTWLYENATGITMRRIDWSYTCNAEIDGYNRGFYANVSVTENSKPNGQSYGLELHNCKTGVHIDAISGAGYMFTRVNTSGCETGVQLDGGADGPALFYGCELSSVLMSATATSPLMMQGCTVSGSTDVLGGELIASDCKFNGDVLVNPIARIAFNGNTCKNLTNNSVFKCTVSSEKLAVRPLPTFQPEWMAIQNTRPAKAALYVVTDEKYGAKPVDITVSLNGEGDNAAAIQKALDEAGAAGGGIVYLPSGHYRMNSAIRIPAGVELKGSSDLATVPKGNGAVLEVMTGEGNENGTPFITMEKGSGLRGVTVNYPAQDNPTAVRKYPYTVRGNADVYIVNLSLRAAYRGVDMFTNKCDNHYVDYLAGHTFMNLIRVGKGSENGIISNIQCNTIAYACGDETKFGQWPNCAKMADSYGLDYAGKAYGQNYEDLDFLIVGDCNNEVLYNNFLFGCNKGMHFVNDGNGGAQNVRSMGNAVDGAVNTFVIEGIGSDLDLVNSQVVALDHKENIIKKSEEATFVTLGSGVTKQVTMMSSCHWGGGAQFAKVQGGTLSMVLTNFSKAGETNSFTIASGAKANVTTSRFSDIKKFSATSGTDEQRATVVASVLNLTGATASRFSKYSNNLELSWTMNNTSAFLSRTGWIATASKNSGNARRSIDGDATTRWDTGGSQNNGQWFKVDMKAAKTFNTVVLDATQSPNDGPAGYKVEVSSDNSMWTTVSEGTNGGSMMFITFDKVTARYVRVTQTGTKSNYWSIHEFNVGNLSIQTTDISQAFGDDADTMVEVVVYTLSGQKAGTSLTGLPAGIYIVIPKGNLQKARKVQIR